METKHTSGEWEAWMGSGKFAVTGPAAASKMVAVSAMQLESYGFFVELASESRECPGIALGDTRGRAEANARLISAAPDLLEALQLMLEHAKRERWAGEFIGKAIHAIDKATGVKP